MEENKTGIRRIHFSVFICLSTPPTHPSLPPHSLSIMWDTELPFTLTLHPPPSTFLCLLNRCCILKLQPPTNTLLLSVCVLLFCSSTLHLCSSSSSSSLSGPVFSSISSSFSLCNMCLHQSAKKYVPSYSHCV